jgi:putative holliday junction resolvase
MEKKITGRILAFDYGTVRVGVAVCDPDQILATPLERLDNNETLPMKFEELIQEYQPALLVIGLPNNLDGSGSQSGFGAKELALNLKEWSNLPVALIDERRSTLGASALLQSGGVNSKKAREKIDSAAAVLILESAMALNKSNNLELLP